MPIHKRDRSFQNIVREVNIEKIPVEFIQSLSVRLKNGDRIIFGGDDIREIDEENIVLFLKSIVEELSEEYGSPVDDLEIVINYDGLEKEIQRLTKNLLDKESSGDDSGDTST
jgi:hypothetical protein